MSTNHQQTRCPHHPARRHVTVPLAGLSTRREFEQGDEWIVCVGAEADVTWAPRGDDSDYRVAMRRAAEAYREALR